MYSLKKIQLKDKAHSQRFFHQSLIKTIVIVLVTILLTTIIMQNTGTMGFQILWMHFYLSKLLIMLFVALTAFVLGWLAGRPKRKFNLGENAGDADHNDQHPGTLSDEDRDYIS